MDISIERESSIQFGSFSGRNHVIASPPDPPSLAVLGVVNPQESDSTSHLTNRHDIDGVGFGTVDTKYVCGPPVVVRTKCGPRRGMVIRVATGRKSDRPVSKPAGLALHANERIPRVYEQVVSLILAEREQNSVVDLQKPRENHRARSVADQFGLDPSRRSHDVEPIKPYRHQRRRGRQKTALSCAPSEAAPGTSPTRPLRTGTIARRRTGAGLR